MNEIEPRTLLGRDFGVGHLYRSYRRGDSIEIDESDHTQITRRRIFFSDVELVTLHSERRLLVPILIALLFVIPGLLFLSFSFLLPMAFRIGAGAIVALAVGGVIASTITPTFVLTVLGRGVRARARLGVREAKARETLDEILLAVSEAQKRARAANPPQERAEARVGGGIETVETAGEPRAEAAPSSFVSSETAPPPNDP